MSIQVEIEMQWFCLVIRPVREITESKPVPLSTNNFICYSYNSQETIDQEIERFKVFRLKATIDALPPWSVQSLPSSPLKQFLMEEIKKGATLAYIYQKYSQHPHYEWLLNYSVRNFRGRVFENEYYLFSDKSYCKISDVITRKDHEQRKKALKLLKKGAKASFIFTIKVLGAK